MVRGKTKQKSIRKDKGKKLKGKNIKFGRREREGEKGIKNKGKEKRRQRRQGKGEGREGKR